MLGDTAWVVAALLAVAAFLHFPTKSGNLRNRALYLNRVPKYAALILCELDAAGLPSCAAVPRL
jgi:hypothetical protein